MNSAQHRAAIKEALNDFAAGSLAENARNLLNKLGYRSERVLAIEPNTAEGFVDMYDLQGKLNHDRALTAEWVSIDPVFQLRGEDLTLTDTTTWLFDPSQTQVDNTIIESYVFLALQLSERNYNRTQLSQITREINKLFPMPAMLLFLHGETLTLSVINRRLHAYDESRDVLEKVTLIKDINFSYPHRAHIDILYDLSLKPLNQTHGVRNFVELHRAWEQTLDTEALNKDFYKELFDWFEWTVAEGKFPTDEKLTLKPQEHIIRLITRLLFIWFIKEKGLVADELFNEAQVSPLLKDYDRDTGDSYYRAVLQNLFFATLNTEIGKRGFSKGGNPRHRDFSLYRYKGQMVDSDKLLALFAQTPFINGGLFDCLDSFRATGDGGYRIDCFSDKHYKKLSLPNCLFFDEKRGLIPLLQHYKFTVEENTPIEQEVALDPELLGKVFENLLAAHNPETGATARKQTGSYYTPRPIVDYMVDEALVATLAAQVSPTDGDARLWEEELRYLFDYARVCDDASVWFDDDETDGIVRTISELKILDPAVGSGAFPMGVLHKLTLALRRLDPDNNRWEALQKERAAQRAAEAFDTQDDQLRREELLEINETFERYRDSDFGRKLYLIQNSIFGVDIQPVACQIAKLRFFISLAIEQEPDSTADNFGIKPLPNLETRFVAANTLIGLESSEATPLLQDDAVIRLRKEIEAIREKYFLANNRGQKLRLEAREADLHKRLEAELETQRAKWVKSEQRKIEQAIAKLRKPEQRKKWREDEQKKYEELKEKSDSDFEYARKIISWKPYDQNASADFFDPEWMFGIRQGFDITIGNPPYVRADSGDEHLKMRQKIEDSSQYKTLWEKWDLYIPFIERSYKLLKPGGFTTLIVSDAYCHSKYAQKSQNYFLKNSRILRLDFFSKIKIFDAGVHNVTYLFQKADGSHQKPERRVHYPEFGVVNLLPTNEQRELTYRVFFPEDIATPEFFGKTLMLAEICYISVGMVAHADEKVAPGAFRLNDLLSDKKDQLHPKAFVEGKNLKKWVFGQHRFIEWGTKRAPNMFRRPTFAELYEHDAKIMLPMVGEVRAALDTNRFYCNHGIFVCLPWYYLSGVSNRSIKRTARYRDEGLSASNLPPREDLEHNSRNFAIKYLLGVLNSTPARDFLRANRRNNIQLYPDDWKNVPIPDVSSDQQKPIIELVDQILDAKRADPNTDVSDLEKRIDQIVYLLYGLTPEEIAIVEEGV